MKAARALFAAVAALVLAGALAGGAAGQGAEGVDILCDDAPPGSVETVPPPLDAWIVVLCTPDGQALAPRVRGTVEVWLHRDTAETFLLPAGRRGFVGETPSVTKHDVRFSDFSGRLATGPHRELLLELWQHAWRDAAPPAALHEVYQLDVRSVFGPTDFNIFVYTRTDGPRWMIVCREQCRQALAIDVLHGDELEARIAGRGRQAR
jgi:hypothetical protein